MLTNTTYWFNRSMEQLVREADEEGEVIPRIKVFLKREGDINQCDGYGDTLLSRAKVEGLLKVVHYLEGRGAKTVEKICSICLENIISHPVREKESERMLPCRHPFHRECIAKWLAIKDNCPVCSANSEAMTLHSQTGSVLVPATRLYIFATRFFSRFAKSS